MNLIQKKSKDACISNSSEPDNDLSLKNDFVNDFILKNFHTYESDSEDSKDIYISNSCGPDSLFQSLTSLYVDFPILFSKIPRDNDILSLLIAMSEKEVDAAYKIRASILTKNFPTTSRTNRLIVECKGNIKIALENIFMKTFPSITLWCDCGEGRSTFSVVDVDLSELFIRGFEQIEKCLLFPRRTCTLCGSRMDHFMLGNILFIDVESLPTFDKDGKQIIKERKIDIKSIQTEINFKNIVFSLRGIINYNHSIVHYNLKCLRKDNIWYTYDDLEETSNRNARSVWPQILIYSQNLE